MIDQIMYIYMAGEHIKWVYIYTKKLAPDVGEVLMTYIYNIYIIKAHTYIGGY